MAKIANMANMANIANMADICQKLALVGFTLLCLALIKFMPALHCTALHNAALHDIYSNAVHGCR
jgi:hypothetical protein